MVEEASGGDCPANVADSPGDVQNAGSNSVALSFLSGSLTRQAFSVPLEGLRVLERVGKVGLCYGLPNCAATAETPCSKFVGVALWTGPSAGASTRVTVCDKLAVSGCVFRIEGHNMDKVDYTVLRVALTEECGVSPTCHWRGRG